MTLMHPHMIKLLSLSGLTLGLLAASQGVRADEVKAPRPYPPYLAHAGRAATA